MEGIRTPRQRRGQDALDRLLDAGSELLAERGFEGFTLSEVGKRAGVSNGAMYWRLENKDALLHAIHDRFQEQAANSVEALSDPTRWDGLTISEAVEGAVRVVALVFSYDPLLMRALSLRAGGDPAILEKAAASLGRGGQAFRDLLEPRLEAAGHRSPAETVGVVFTAMTGAMAARITWPEFALGPPLEWEPFVDCLCRMAVSEVQAGLPD